MARGSFRLVSVIAIVVLLAVRINGGVLLGLAADDGLLGSLSLLLGGSADGDVIFILAGVCSLAFGCDGSRSGGGSILLLGLLLGLLVVLLVGLLGGLLLGSEAGEVGCKLALGAVEANTGRGRIGVLGSLGKLGEVNLASAKISKQILTIAL